MLTIDLSRSEDKECVVEHCRGRWECLRCHWRGYRVVKVRTEFGQYLDKAAATAEVKGQSDGRGCPHCGSSLVIFTHVT